MKLRTTKKAIRYSGNIILGIPYCDAQYLLNFKTPFAYSDGVYGWSCDYYQLGNVIISTGYSYIGSRVPADLVREYNDKAYKLVSSYHYGDDVEKLTEQVDLLLGEFIDKARDALNLWPPTHSLYD